MLKHLIFGALVFVFVLLQMQLWGEGGTRETIARQTQQELEMLDRISAHEHETGMLADEVEYLSKDPDAIEAKARSDLGMIKKDETLIFLPNNTP